MAPGSLKGEFDTFISFDLSPFNTIYGAGGWLAQSITLRLNATSPGNSLFNSSAAGQFTIEWIPNNSWVEGTGDPKGLDTNPAEVDFTNHTNYLAGAESLGTFGFDGSTNGQFTYTLTPTPDFTAAVQSGGTVSLYVTAANTGVSYLFNAKDFGEANGAPQADPALTINVRAVPEPGSLSILAAGAAALASFVRRRRALK